MTPWFYYHYFFNALKGGFIILSNDGTSLHLSNIDSPIYKLPYVKIITKPCRKINFDRVLQMVEAGGIGPPSESSLTGTSPGAVCSFHSLAMAETNTLHTLVAS